MLSPRKKNSYSIRITRTIDKWNLLLLLILSMTVACQGTVDKHLVANKVSANPTGQEAMKRHSDTIPASVNPYVNDFEKVFTKLQADSLIKTISAVNKTDSIVFCVVTIDSSLVKPDQFDAFTLDLANYWGVGDKNKDNGIVICFSKKYRRLRIQNGKGIEKMITNAETDSVMQSVIFSKFKEGNYFGGVSEGISSMTELIRKRRSSFRSSQIKT